MSGIPTFRRLPLFTFNECNTLTVTDPTLPAIEFDDENNLASVTHVEESTAPLQFTNENILITELSISSASISPEMVVEDVTTPMPEVVIDHAAPTPVAQHASTWPRQCPTCHHVTNPAVVVEALVAQQPANNQATLRLLIDTSTATELQEMITTMQMHLSLRRLSFVPETPAPANFTLKKEKKRWMTTLRLRLGIKMWTRDRGKREIGRASCRERVF